MLIEHVVKVFEHNGKRSEVDEMQCNFMTGCGSRCNFLFSEKHSAANKLLYMASVDLEKTFDCVPLDFIW